MKNVCVVNHSLLHLLQISRTDGTETAGDNEANGVFDTENLNNIKMGAAYIAPDISKY